jgi:aerobic-type carbon monoxide dehydrogenase small subunit (CoxS/CutS family)
MVSMELRVNGVSHQVETDPSTPLVFILRNQLGLTGTKLGCGLEQCGSCTVLVDGEPVMSCVRAVSEFGECEIVTVEGLTEGGEASAVQRAFIEANAAQCGYCTPGIVVAVTALLTRNPRPGDAEIHEALHGHLCRCGSHARVLAAIETLVAGGDANAR